MDDAPDVRELEDRPPGYETEDPYEDVSIADLPDWWQTAIEEFETHGFRPYRPPVFEDGKPVPTVVDRLETEFDASVRIMGVDVDYGDRWQILVDGDVVAKIDRRREPTGRTVYGTTRTELESLVRETRE